VVQAVSFEMCLGVFLVSFICFGGGFSLEFVFLEGGGHFFRGV